MKSQVYDYLPVSLSNIETNPSFVASENSKFFAGVSHIDNFNKAERFSYTSVRVSKFFKYKFFGAGLIASNTVVYDSLNYQHLGLAFAYRNILFNAVYLKLGFTYKFININAPEGNFMKYGFEFKDNALVNSFKQNFNYSITISSPKEKYYLTYGLLNMQPLWSDSDSSSAFFPKYMYITAGDLGRLILKYRGMNLSFSVLGEQYNNEAPQLTYYLNFFNILQIDRRKRLRYGGNIGYRTNQYLNIRPAAYLYIPKAFGKRKRYDRRRRYNDDKNIISIKLSADFAIRIKSGEKIYKPAYQLYLMYNI